MMHKQSTICLGLVAISTVVNGFVSPHGTSTTISSSSLQSPVLQQPQTRIRRRRPLQLSIFPDDLGSSNDKPSSKSSSSQAANSLPNIDPTELDLPTNIEVPIDRQLRWERERLVQSKYTSGDEIYELRTQTLDLKSKLKDARRQYNQSTTKLDKVKANTIIHKIEQELFSLETRDAEFMYAVTSELMEKAELKGDTQAVEKYKIGMEEARSCIPQLNLHGLWVGKYGEHGYEMINVTYSGNTLIATKVTGDANVPKGEVTFTVDLTPQIPSSTSSSEQQHLPPIELDPQAQKQWGKKYLPRFIGKGQVASENFTNAQWMDGQMIIVGRFFSFAWVPIGHQIFFGRPSSELTIKMLKEAKEDEMKRDHVAVMREEANNMLEETYWSEKESTTDFDEVGSWE